MGKIVIALNESKTRQAGNWAARSLGGGAKVFHCSSLAQLQALPPATYSCFLLGNGRGITPEQLAYWMAVKVLQRTGIDKVLVDSLGNVPKEREFIDVIHGHFGQFEGRPKVVIVNEPSEPLVEAVRRRLFGPRLLPCTTVDELMALPEGFYEWVIVGEADHISVEQLAGWMDAKVPEHRQYQMSIVDAGDDKNFLNVHRRHLSRL